jgi:tRNA C32,U32 (ribose-2'-O)-methylase TrmJ
MNLGQAVAVCLYELARGAGAAGSRGVSNSSHPKEKTKSAATGELERITTILIDALRASGYLGERSVAAKEEKIRRMVRRLELSSADAELWLGMLRQMLWKMGRHQ